MKLKIKNFSLKNPEYFFIKTNLITNFKPNIFNGLKNQNLLNLKKFNKNKKINKDISRLYCKNFFVYLLLIKYKNNFLFNDSSVFIKKLKKKVYTILRSPYRHKLARHQIALIRYEINSSIKIKLKNSIYIKNWKKLIILFNFLKSFNNIFESNIIYTNSIKISLSLAYTNNFNFNHFLNKNK